MMIQKFIRIFSALLILQTLALATDQREGENPSRVLPRLPHEMWEHIISFLKEDKDRLPWRRVHKQGLLTVEQMYKKDASLPSLECFGKLQNETGTYPFTLSHFLRKNLKTDVPDLKCLPGSEPYLMMWEQFAARLSSLYALYQKEDVSDTIARVLENTSTGSDKFEVGILYKLEHIKNLHFNTPESIRHYEELQEDIMQYARYNLGNPSEKKKKIVSAYMKEFLDDLFHSMTEKFPLLFAYLSGESNTALLYVGGLYYLVDDFPKAQNYWKKAAKQGYRVAQNNLGALLEKKGDTKRALKYYQLAADQGHMMAQYNLGNLFEENGNIKRAFQYWKLAADQGHAQAQNNLGVLFEKKGSTKEDTENALKYYQLAADQGNAVAQCNLGYFFEQKDNTKNALEYYRLAADQGNVRAQNNLRILFEKKGYTKEDTENALKYYQLAADQGNADAQYKLGCFFERKGDVKIALLYYQLAADQGHVDAQYTAGYFFEENNSMKMAFQYWKLAADQGHPNAQNNLGALFLKNDDTENAFRYWKLAADQGHLYAQNNLGYLLEEIKDVRTALYYYQLAAAQGCKEAPHDVQRLRAILEHSTPSS